MTVTGTDYLGNEIKVTNIVEIADAIPHPIATDHRGKRWELA